MVQKSEFLDSQKGYGSLRIFINSSLHASQSSAQPFPKDPPEALHPASKIISPHMGLSSLALLIISEDMLLNSRLLPQKLLAASLKIFLNILKP